MYCRPLKELREEIGGEAAQTGNMSKTDIMMAAILQLMQESKDRATSSIPQERQIVPVITIDLYLKQFQDMRPPQFKGKEGPIEAECWLSRIEQILEGMMCPANRKVALATFALKGEANNWWRNQRQIKLQGLNNANISWEEFEDIFREWFIPPSARMQMQEKFLRLVQRDMTVMQYEIEFTTLLRYAHHIIPSEAEKCYRFLNGLRDAIRKLLVPQEIEKYSELVETARRIEIDLEATQKRKESQQKRRSGEFTKKSKSENSSVKKVKTIARAAIMKSNTIPQCSKCNKMHWEECHFKTKVCYKCNQPGHIVKYCPERFKQGRKRKESIRGQKYH